MSVSRKSMVGGVVGVIIALGFIVVGMFAFSGSPQSLQSTTSIVSSTTSSVQGTTLSFSTSQTSSIGSGQTTTSTTSNVAGGSSANSGISTGVLQVSMIDPPHVPAEVVGVYVNYSSIQVHVASAGNESGWHNVTASGTINLMTIVNNSEVMGSASLPAGTYNIVRFNITSALVTVKSSTGGLLNYTVSIPSGKVQAVITGGALVQTNGVTKLLIDISPRVNGANGSYMLVPSATASVKT